MSRKTVKGTIGEHKAIIQLMEDGYHVARSVDPQCPFDLVAVGEDGDVKLIDVKTVAIRKKIKPNWTIKSKRVNRVLTAIQKKMGVEHLMVD
jgi:tRNA pseudouridine-54 N-methylase|tara:strand:+ start:76 stop:351 length:276 start_codon:yes stop_codon:yes gene_type:complete